MHPPRPFAHSDREKQIALPPPPPPAVAAPATTVVATAASSFTTSSTSTVPAAASVAPAATVGGGEEEEEDDDEEKEEEEEGLRESSSTILKFGPLFPPSVISKVRARSCRRTRLASTRTALKPTGQISVSQWYLGRVESILPARREEERERGREELV